jgi:hypothetical protein
MGARIDVRKVLPPGVATWRESNASLSHDPASGRAFSGCGAGAASPKSHAALAGISEEKAKWYLTKRTKSEILAWL